MFVFVILMRECLPMLGLLGCISLQKKKKKNRKDTRMLSSKINKKIMCRLRNFFFKVYLVWIRNRVWVKVLEPSVGSRFGTMFAVLVGFGSESGSKP